MLAGWLMMTMMTIEAEQNRNCLRTNKRGKQKTIASQK